MVEELINYLSSYFKFILPILLPFLIIIGGHVALLNNYFSNLFKRDIETGEDSYDIASAKIGVEIVKTEQKLFKITKSFIRNTIIISLLLDLVIYFITSSQDAKVLPVFKISISLCTIYFINHLFNSSKEVIRLLKDFRMSVFQEVIVTDSWVITDEDWKNSPFNPDSPSYGL